MTDDSDELTAVYMVGLHDGKMSSQRKWVGLTDEEIAEIEDEYTVNHRIPAGCAWNFARAIEAKLKEKNDRQDKR